MKRAAWWSTFVLVMALGGALAAWCRGAKPEEGFVRVPLDPLPHPRTVRPLPDQAFHVEWVAHDVPAVIQPGAKRLVTVTVRNTSTLPWPDPDASSYEPPEVGAVRLTCRWWPASSPPSGWGPRADLDRLLQPGQVATLRLTVTAPSVPGDYRLQFDLVQEMAVFFGDKGADQLVVPLRVR